MIQVTKHQFPELFLLKPPSCFLEVGFLAPQSKHTFLALENLKRKATLPAHLPSSADLSLPAPTPCANSPDRHSDQVQPSQTLRVLTPRPVTASPLL